MAGKIDGYTVDNLARSTDEAVIRDAVASIRTVVRNRDKVGESLLAAQAFATRAALDSKVYSKTDLTKQWANPSTEKDLNVSTITLYDRLGLAATNLGVLPKGIEYKGSGRTVWSLLGGRGGATISAVGMYIEKGQPIGVTDKGAYKYAKKDEVSEPATFEGLIDWLSDYFKPDGLPYSNEERKANAAKRMFTLFGWSDPDAEGGAGEGEGEGDTPPVPAQRSIEARFKDAAANLIALCDLITEESVFKSVRPDMVAIFEKIDATEGQFAEAPKKGRGGRKAS